MTTTADRILYAILLVIFTCGCHFELMSEGSVIFEDETPRPGGRYFDLDRPVAVGASLNLSIEAVGFASTNTLQNVEVSDPEVIEITTWNARGASLKAISAGETTLTAVMADGRVGTLSIEARDVASAELQLFPWDPRIAMDPSHWEDGVVLLEGSATRVYLQLRDDSGSILTGFGAHTPSASDTQLAQLVPHEASDFYTLSHVSGTGPLELAVTGADPYSIEVVPFEAVYEIGLSNPLQQTETARKPVYEGETLQFHSRGDLLHVDARTADGQYVMGNSGLSLEVRIHEQSALSIIMGDEESAEADDFIQRAFNRGRAFLMSGRTDGPEELEISWGPLTATVFVESR